MPDPFPILLSGPPASGKSTLTSLLTASYPAFELVRKVKDSHQGSQTGYEIVSAHAFDEMIDTNQLLQWNARYGRRYGVTASAVKAILEQGKCPIIHLGKYSSLKLVRQNLPTSLSIFLWVPESRLMDRLAIRHADEPRELKLKMPAYREEQLEMLANCEALDFDLVFQNNGNDPVKAAQALYLAITQWTEAGKPVRRDAGLLLSF